MKYTGNFADMEHIPYFENIVDQLCKTAQSTDRHMFRIILAYYYGKVAASMNVTIQNWYNPLPANIYAFCLAESGSGKGLTIGTVENKILRQFTRTFIEDTFPLALTEGIDDIAQFRANRRGTSLKFETDKLWRESDNVGHYQMSFSENTSSASIRQLRHKLLLANAGSLNAQVDEIGDNIGKMSDIISILLELYDTGSAKEGMTKNTGDNKRYEYVEGTTPTNMFVFGTHTTLLDGSDKEATFMSMLNSGYARRSFFAFSESARENRIDQSPEEAVRSMFKGNFANEYAALSSHFEKLAHINNLGTDMPINEDAALYLMEYKYHCEQRSAQFTSTESVLTAEMMHRYFKVLKLAACTSFIVNAKEITIEHLEAAIKLAEVSGEHLMRICKPEKDFMRLANYIKEKETDLTFADISAELPCFNGSASKKQDMLMEAIAYGYKNNILITRKMVDDIVFIQGTSLTETDLDSLIMSISDDFADGYKPLRVTYEDLTDVAGIANMNWCNHHFIDEHRHMDDIIERFNLIVLDIDDGTPMDAVISMLDGYYCFFHETKRSTAECNRFRVILPISHELCLDREDYNKLVNNLIDALPFDGIVIDSSSSQPEKKWLTNDCDDDQFFLAYDDMNGEECKLFDILPFIPRTHKQEIYAKNRKQYQNATNLEYWMISNTMEGNRNKMMHRYAMVLIDLGHDENQIRDGLIAISEKMKDGLSVKEIDSTVMKTVKRKLI